MKNFLLGVRMIAVYIKDPSCEKAQWCQTRLYSFCGCFVGTPFKHRKLCLEKMDGPCLKHPFKHLCCRRCRIFHSRCGWKNFSTDDDLKFKCVCDLCSHKFNPEFLKKCRQISVLGDPCQIVHEDDFVTGPVKSPQAHYRQVVEKSASQYSALKLLAFDELKVRQTETEFLGDFVATWDSLTEFRKRYDRLPPCFRERMFAARTVGIFFSR